MGMIDVLAKGLLNKAFTGAVRGIRKRGKTI
jgi:hypothetical protein